MSGDWGLLVGSGAYWWGVVPISGEWGLLVRSGAY